MKRNTVTLVIGALLIVIFAVLLFTFQVRTTQVAVVTTFGKPTRTIMEPSGRPHFKWPWPIQKVHYFDKRVQNFDDDKFREDMTADGNTLLTMAFVGWRISDPEIFFPKFAGGSVVEARKQLASLVSSKKSAVIGKHPLSDFVSASGDGSKFIAIENEILASVQSTLETNNYGIKIEFLGIKRLGLPSSVTEKVFERMTSERKVLSDQLQSEGQKEVANIRSGAERRAAEVLAEARGKATEIQGRAEAEAAEHLAVFEQNPELANFLFRLSAIEEAMKEKTTLILDQQTPPFDLLRSTSTNRPTR